MDINERKLLILKAIIDDFVSTAQPVGSRTIAKKHPLGISSATIRNEMADLEDLGLLRQPHTSSGRIPSSMGYRLYVDSIMERMRLALSEQEKIQSLLIRNLIEPVDVVTEAVKLLSNLTNMTAIISLPRFTSTRLENLKMVKLNDQKVLLILVSNSGAFKTISLAMSHSQQNLLDELSNIITEHLYGLTIKDIDIKTIAMLKMKLVEFGSLIDYMLPILRDTFRDIDNEIEIYVDGVRNVLNLPEFSERDRAQEYFEMMENRDKLSKILSSFQSEQIGIKIGTEIGIDELSDCSMVNASYKMSCDTMGKIAVIGPMRMDYGSVVSVVDYIRETLSDIFSGISL